jgi:hypothetical protein
MWCHCVARKIDEWDKSSVVRGMSQKPPTEKNKVGDLSPLGHIIQAGMNAVVLLHSTLPIFM